MKRFFYLSLAILLMSGCNGDEDQNPDVPSIDTTSPNAICKSDTVYLNECNSVLITVDDIDGGSTDDIGIDTMWLDRYAFSFEDTGIVHQITLNILDVSNNYASCISNITVIDTTPKPKPEDFLDFEMLIGFIGTSPDNVLESAPGMIVDDTLILGARQLYYLLEPTNINLEVSLFMMYDFSNKGLSQIGLFSAFEIDQRDLIYQLSILGDQDDWFNSSTHLLYYYKGNTESLKFFDTAEDLWEFIATENVSRFDIKMASSKWESGDAEMMLAYLGESTDSGAGIIEPNDSRKSTVGIEDLYIELKEKVKILNQ